MVAPLAKAGVAVGADGLLVEVHNQPERALSDGAQSLNLEQYHQMVDEVHAIHNAMKPAVCEAG
jgi:3-deoxy-7-phosphoheptulonate synthase